MHVFTLFCDLPFSFYRANIPRPIFFRNLFCGHYYQLCVPFLKTFKVCILWFNILHTTYIDTHTWILLLPIDRGGGGIRGVVEKKLLSNTRRYRHAVLYFIQMQLTSLHFFPWGTYSLFSLTSTTTYLRSLCTRRRRPRVFTIICVVSV